MQTSKANLALCAKKVRLLSGQDYFKSEDALLDLLIKALVHQSDDEAHIDRIIAAWIGRTRQMLHPSDVPNLAHETSERVSLPPGCEVCRGENHVYVTINGKDAMDRCECARGRRLAEIDKQKRSEKSAAASNSLGK